jgi:hypothetical protein
MTKNPRSVKAWQNSSSHQIIGAPRPMMRSRGRTERSPAIRLIGPSNGAFGAMSFGRSISWRPGPCRASRLSTLPAMASSSIPGTRAATPASSSTCGSSLGIASTDLIGCSAILLIPLVSSASWLGGLAASQRSGFSITRGSAVVSMRHRGVPRRTRHRSRRGGPWCTPRRCRVAGRGSGHLPQRTAAVERACGQPGNLLGELLLVSGRGQRDLADVVLDVELVIVD